MLPKGQLFVVGCSDGDVFVFEAKVSTRSSASHGVGVGREGANCGLGRMWRGVRTVRASYAVVAVTRRKMGLRLAV